MTGTASPQHFALLGQSVSPLLMAIERSDFHTIMAVVFGELGDVRRHDHWESLLTDEAVDAVIVCGHEPDVLEAARRLAARGQPLIVPVWTTFPPEFVAELSLYDAEGSSTLLPCFESRWVIEPLRQLIAEGRLGSITHIQLERSLRKDDTADEHPTWYSGVSFDDIDFLRVLGGDYSQVTLIRSGGSDHGSFVTQTLQLAGAGLPDATCTYHRVDAKEMFRLRVDGTQAAAELLMADKEDFVIRVDGVELHRCLMRNGFPAILESLNQSWQQEPGGPRWRDFVRVQEISEAMQRSLRRRRTIDLHFETASERSQFKTQMATVGCFVLVYTFFASVLMLLAGAVFDPRDELQRKAEAAQFVLPLEEFDSSSGELSQQGEDHLQEIADRWQAAGAVVIIESDPQEAAALEPSDADRQRLANVQQRLTRAGVERVEERTILRTVKGRGFRKLMTAGRVIAFAPLSLFLLMQLLLIVARPAHEAQGRSNSSASKD